MIFRTAEEVEEVRRLYWDDGLTIQQVADKLFCSVDAVHHCMVKHNIPRRPSAFRRGGELYDVGGRMMTSHQIAEETGVAYSTVRRRIGHGWRGEKLLLPKQRRGGRHGNMG